MSSMRASTRNHGMGVVMKFVKRKTKRAPRSSPKLDPPTIICDQAEVPRYLWAMAGAIPFSR